MKTKDFIRMALEAGAKPSNNPEKWDILEISYESLERFAELVAEHERDRYAEKFAELIAPKICELLTEHRQFKAVVIVGQYFRDKQAGHDVIERPWVGLTMLDMAELRQGGFHNITDERFRAIESKLRSKNT